MFRHRLYYALAAASVLSLALSGCTSAAAPATLDPAESPLREYVSALYPSDDDAINAQQKKIETLVAACMTEEGFDYVPVDQSQFAFESDDEDQNTEKWISEHGYGMTQTPEEIEAQSDTTSDIVDPNEDYIETLTPGQQTAYFATLYGATPAEEDLVEDATADYAWEDAGCLGSAQHEVNGDDPSTSEAYKPLLDALSALDESVQKTPAVTELNASWSECMADAGYPSYRSKPEAQNTLTEELNALYGSEGDDPVDEAAIGSFRDKEIEVALADFACSDEVRYTEVSLAARFALETQFIADHKSELDALVATVEQGK